MSADRPAQAGAEPYMTVGARKAARRLGWSLLVLCVLVLFFGSANLLFTACQVNTVRRANISSCRFFGDLAGAPVAEEAATRKASLLGVEIVAGSRVEWRGRGCAGKLPPPDPSFVRWARFYRLPYR